MPILDRDNADWTILNRLTSGLNSAIGQDKMLLSTGKVMLEGELPKVFHSERN